MNHKFVRKFTLAVRVLKILGLGLLLGGTGLQAAITEPGIVSMSTDDGEPNGPLNIQSGKPQFSEVSPDWYSAHWLVQETDKGTRPINRWKSASGAGRTGAEPMGEAIDVELNNPEKSGKIANSNLAAVDDVPLSSVMEFHVRKLLQKSLPIPANVEEVVTI